jgi:glycosyltransferase involved in cell wall biosynthesis
MRAATESVEDLTEQAGSGSEASPGGLRILTVMNCAGSHSGGMPTGNASISRELRVLGCTVDHLYLEDCPRWMRTPPLNYPVFGAACVVLIRRLDARRGGYDVIQISGGDGYLASALRRAPGGRRRLIVARCHGLEHRYWQAHRREVEAGFESRSLRHRLYFGGLRLRQVEQTVRRADLFNCHTRADADYVIARRWKRPEEVVVLPSGIEPDWLEGPLEQAAPQGRILFCGSWTWVKGRRVLVEVFARLARQDAAVSLTVIGAGTGERIVLDAFSPDVRGRVTVRPGLSHPEVLREFGRHDVLLATSLFEGFGTVVVEAMAAGLPVIAAEVGGAGDLVRDGTTGCLVRSGDIEGFVGACRKVLSASPVQVLPMRQAARRSVSGIKWPEIARGTLEAYKASLDRVRGAVDS